MPIEIRELTIKAVVNNAGAGPTPTGPQAPPSKEEKGVDEDRLIAKCVEKVMEILDRKKEF